MQISYFDTLSRLPLRRIASRDALRGAVAMFMLVAMYGCGGETRERAGDLTKDSKLHELRLPSDRMLVDSFRVDFHGDSLPALVVTTRLLDDGTVPAGGFDRIDIYAPASWNRPVCTDILEYGIRSETRDITGDGLPELIVHVDAGGNNPVASMGMHVYGRGAAMKITQIFYSAEGAPVLRDLDNNGTMQILVSDQYWGMMPHSEAVLFTRDVHAFDGSRYVPATSAYAHWYAAEIAGRRKAFAALKNRDAGGGEMREQLYSAAVELLVWTWAASGNAGVQQTWKKEARALRTLLPEQYYDDLLTFVEDVDIMSRQEVLP